MSEERKTILVSACLLGLPCRYDGKGAPDAAVLALAKKHQLVPVCPEQLGGLATPRPPVELRDGRAVDREGRDVTDSFRRGAEMACEIARLCGCTHAVLKDKSPSCGTNFIYDGSFSGTLMKGRGVTAEWLAMQGFILADAEQLD